MAFEWTAQGSRARRDPLAQKRRDAPGLQGAQLLQLLDPDLTRRPRRAASNNNCYTELR
ncbi:hypothetical protein [Desulfocurvibacter africanus]|uniref:hypothetical protein n=1 Tax=Desulfocurvibacter africanus TaxID=873 RepID=UPI0002E11603|nr:hypothetical protein [Desulfocurvibacter africanus]